MPTVFVGVPFALCYCLWSGFGNKQGMYPRFFMGYFNNNLNIWPMSKIFLHLYEQVSYWGIDESGLSLKNRDSIMLTNQYLFLLAIIFSIHSFFSFLFIGLDTTTFFLLGISFLFFITFLSFKSFNFFKLLRNNRYAISFVFLLLCSITTYYSSVNQLYI